MTQEGLSFGATAPREGHTMTCVWNADPGCLGDDWESMDPGIKERSLLLATSTLQTLTYNRVGTCPVTVRPCPETHSCGCAWQPHIWEGKWYNSCSHRPFCEPTNQIELEGPVGYIDSIVADGVELDISDFRLDDGRFLVWEGTGPSPIPSVQNLDLPLSEVGTWGVTYSRSHPVGAEGEIAVAILAKEFAEACKPRGKCSLPKGVQSVVRNGVSFTIESGSFIGGMTGIQTVDAFILKWVQPGMPGRTASVFSPRKRAERTTGAVPRRHFGGSL